MPDSINTTDTPPAGGQGFPANNPDGTPGLVGPDEYTRWVNIQRYTRPPNQIVVGGNFADLQRMGEVVAGGPGVKGSANPAIATAPTVDPSADNYVTAPQAEAARGEWTRETERVGLLDAPPAPVPAENKEPNAVDPTSVSPTTESKGGASRGPVK